MTALHGLVVAVALALPAQSPALVDPPAACQLSDANHRWVQRALDGWHRISRDALRLPASPLPWIVLYDDTCAWHLAFDDALLVEGEPAALTLVFAGAPVRVRARPHAGRVWLPNGSETPAAQNTARASLYRNGTDTFFVMALPDMWRRDPQIAQDPHADDFFLGVAIHELTHTKQLPSIVDRLKALARRYRLTNLSLDDDLIQNRFGAIAGVRRAYEAERELLFQAVAAPDGAKRTALAARALTTRQRRARAFTGSNQQYADFEDVFLSMEGAGQWAAYKLAQSDTRAGETDAVVIDFVRSTRKYWSQEEGLALFLLLDRLRPGWQDEVFGGGATSPFDLLEMALRARRSQSGR